jgi:hypothetical protein
VYELERCKTKSLVIIEDEENINNAVNYFSVDDEFTTLL